MIVGKTELKRRITDLTRKMGVGNIQMELLIESLWRDPYSLRTSGFKYAGGTDAEINLFLSAGSGSADDSLVFTIEPVEKKFSFYQYITKLSYHKKYALEMVSVPTEEGLSYIYYTQDQITKEQVLTISDGSGDEENPTFDWLIVNKCMVASVYWDNDKQEAIVFNDQRYGSEWNPQMHKTLRLTLGSLRDSGLSFAELDPDGDGSEETHAQFSIAAGAAWHGDIYRSSAGAPLGPDIPIMYFNGSGYPRIIENPGWAISVGALLQYQKEGALTDADDKYFVLYHIFFTNCEYNEFISVPGINQYDNLSDAILSMTYEQEVVKDKLPYTDALLIGTIIYQTSIEFTNSVHSRIISTSWTVFTDMSVTGDGSLINPVILVNDEESPGPNKVYGTDEYGIKRWKPDPEGGESESGSGSESDSGEEECTVITDMTVTGDGSLSNPVKLVNDEESPGNDKYYGTNEAGEKGYHDLPDAIVTLDKDYEFCVNAGHEDTFVLDIYAFRSYTIDKCIIECDAGTLDGLSVLIGSTPVTGLDDMDITTTPAVFTATANNAVAESNRVTLTTSGVDTGTPTFLRVKIVLT